MVETIVKLAPFCIPTRSLRFGPFLLIWTITSKTFFLMQKKASDNTILCQLIPLMRATV